MNATSFKLTNQPRFSTPMCLVGLVLAVWAHPAMAQSVCLPAPRLLTTMPMGAQVGTTIDVTITGQHFEDVENLLFSHAGIKAENKTDKEGTPVPNQYAVTIADDCPAGLYEARVMTRLGVSTSRIFNVGSLPEVNQAKPNTSLKQAMPLKVDSICNAAMTKQAVDYYSFEAAEKQRIVVDCAANGIDSKLKAVVIIADADGNDLLVERRGGSLDFTAPEAGSYVIKVHDLTFNGGSEYFYRLAIRTGAADDVLPKFASTKTVSSFSWPVEGLSDDNMTPEAEPNNTHATAQKIELPCDISGSFFPAADVDTFEFTAKQGEVWWVEVASERLGLSTDPAIVVQHVADGNGILTDVAELNDIASPVKVSSNGYSYDGPPYNAGSSDILGKLEIKTDGLHRLRLSDLFGGTRNDPRNVYRLIIRKAAPDFALVAWALHMNLRNGDRNALSKPLALRGGATMPIEVVVVRRDGFDGDIELVMEGLPNGVTATGLKIPAGKSRGIMLVTADQNAPRGLANASFFGRATINDKPVVRPCRMASMAWPVPNAWSEIPSPRLLGDVLVSVCGSEFAPITIAANEDKVWEVAVGEKLTIPLLNTRRCDFSGTKMSLKTLGVGFESNPGFDTPLDAENSEAVLDLTKLKPPPGDYLIAFYGSAVAKYRYHADSVTMAEAELAKAKVEASSVAAEVKKLTEDAKTASDEEKAAIEKTAKEAAANQKLAVAAVTAAEKQLKAATTKAAPKDIVDIVVSTPIRIRVKPVEKAGDEK